MATTSGTSTIAPGRGSAPRTASSAAIVRVTASTSATASARRKRASRARTTRECSPSRKAPSSVARPKSEENRRRRSGSTRRARTGASSPAPVCKACASRALTPAPAPWLSRWPLRHPVYDGGSLHNPPRACAGSRGPSRMQVRIVIRAKDEAAKLGTTLTRLAQQTLADRAEVVVVDSGSRDGTVDIARAAGVRVIEIPAESFTYGGAINIGCEDAATPLAVALSAHAPPFDEHWLERVVEPFSDERV